MRILAFQKGLLRDTDDEALLEEVHRRGLLPKRTGLADLRKTAMEAGVIKPIVLPGTEEDWA